MRFLATFTLFSASALAVWTGEFPKCESRQKDPATGLDCGPYGYDGTWVVNDHETEDGSYYLTVNGKWPPPQIVVKKDDRVRIVVENLLEIEDITLHFHGILQENGYNVMDGPEGLVQSGIKPGSSFVYDFPCPRPGTYWIHSHAPGQYPKGLRTPLIVQDHENEKTHYKYEHDWAISVSDWWKNFTHAEELYKDSTCLGGGGIEPPAERIIVNDVVPEWGGETNPTHFTRLFIAPGETARLRFVNMGSFAQFSVFFDDWKKTPGITMRVIELDGNLVKSQRADETVRGFSLASGQRISVLVTRPADDDQAYHRIHFVADTRVSGGNLDWVGKAESDIPDECRLKATEDNTLSQYASLLVTKDEGNPSSTTPFDLQDFDGPNSGGNTETKRLLRTWRCDDLVADPFWVGRTKVPRAYQDRGLVLNYRKSYADGVCTLVPTSEKRSLWVPTDVFGYHDFYYQADTWQTPNEPEIDIYPKYITRIAMRDWKPESLAADNTANPGKYPQWGRAVMSNWEVAGVPNSFWASNQPSWYRGERISDPRMTNLGLVLDASRTVNDLNDPTKWGDIDGPGTFGSQTIVLPNTNEMHWFIVRTTTGDHPLHIHGHDFHLLARLPAETNPDNGSSQKFPLDPQGKTIEIASDGSSVDGKSDWHNYIRDVFAQAPAHPARRDTVMIERGWDYVFGVKSNNPGVWAMHCHNDFHASTGMFMQVISSPQETRQRFGTYQRPAVNLGVCTDPYATVAFDLPKDGTINTEYAKISTTGAKTWPGIEQLLRGSAAWLGWNEPCLLPQ